MKKQAAGTGSLREQQTEPNRAQEIKERLKAVTKEKGRKRAMRKDWRGTHGRPELVLGRTGRGPWAAGRMPAWIKHRELCKPQAFC